MSGQQQQQQQRNMEQQQQQQQQQQFNQSAAFMQQQQALQYQQQQQQQHLSNRSGGATPDQPQMQPSLQHPQQQQLLNPANYAAAHDLTTLPPAAQQTASQLLHETQLRRNRHQYKEAIAAYDRLLELMPHYVPAWTGKGICFKALKDHVAAVQCFQRSLQLDPTDWSLLPRETMEKHRGPPCLDRSSALRSCFLVSLPGPLTTISV
jgi:tetratricopeptide (TPR) repeat protein